VEIKARRCVNAVAGSRRRASLRIRASPRTPAAGQSRCSPRQLPHALRVVFTCIVDRARQPPLIIITPIDHVTAVAKRSSPRGESRMHAAQRSAYVSSTTVGNGAAGLDSVARITCQSALVLDYCLGTADARCSSRASSTEGDPGGYLFIDPGEIRVSHFHYFLLSTTALCICQDLDDQHLAACMDG
jgi:hypothetical protein